MAWFIQLSGDKADLSAIAQSLTGPELSVERDGDQYFLVLSGASVHDEATTVLDRAKRLVEVLNGAARLALDAREPIRVGSVYRRNPDGRREFYLFAEPGVFRVRGFAPTIAVTRADGTVEVSYPADPIAEWSALAASHDSVANVLRLLGTTDLDWVNLYRVLEIISADVGGLHVVAAKGWASKRSIALFKHTANSPGALGLDARHGAETTTPPPKPMPLSEARSLVRSIVHAWLRVKDLGS